MTRIPLSPAHSTFFESAHDYGDVFVQGGTSGIVIVPGGTNYKTAFVECSPKDSFIRGEGKTLAEADDACWAKLQAYLNCEHAWEPRHYRNGGGICKHCGQFGSKKFTAEDLGLECTVCGEPTFHTLTGGDEVRCKPHDPKWPYFIGQLKALFSDTDDAAVHDMYTRLNNVAYRGAPEDPEALNWAYANLDMSEAPRSEAS